MDCASFCDGLNHDPQDEDRGVIAVAASKFLGMQRSFYSNFPEKTYAINFLPTNFL